MVSYLTTLQTSHNGRAIHGNIRCCIRFYIMCVHFKAGPCQIDDQQRWYTGWTIQVKLLLEDVETEMPDWSYQCFPTLLDLRQTTRKKNLHHPVANP